jgi:hypothetical protein
MNIQHPSIEEQAKSLIAQTKFEFVCRVLNKTTLEVSDYDLVLTITRAEFLRYLQDNFTIESLVKTHTSQRDGFYALKIEMGGLLSGRKEKFVSMNGRLQLKMKYLNSTPV